jgi:Terminase large subunit, T4likevirus-type, N-terminal/Terminase RNaseH-like domain
MALATVAAEQPVGWRYDPLPSQRRFHADLISPYKGYSGPIGSGKSLALTYEALFLSALNAGLLGVIGAPTYPMLRDTTQRTMFEVLANEDIPFRFHKTENIIELPSPPFCGAEILFRSLDEFERLRGTNLAWFGIDELTYCPPQAWSRLQGRLRHPAAMRRCGFAAWTPKGFDWVYEKFISDPKPGYRCTLASPRENKYVTATGMYDALAAGYDERLYRQEVLGEYLSLSSGAAYYAFDRRKNVSQQVYDRRLPICWSLDFNVNPMCSVIAQIQDITSRTDMLNGRRVLVVSVLDELFLADSNTPEACQEFVERTKEYVRLSETGQLMVQIYGDASGSRRQTAVGAGANSDWAVIRDFFRSQRHYSVTFRYRSSNPAVRDRVAAVNAALCNSTQVRRVFIDPRCKNLIRDLEQVVYKPGTTTLDQTTDPQRTHVSDALGYLIENEMGLRGSVGPQPGRLI